MVGVALAGIGDMGVSSAERCGQIISKEFASEFDTSDLRELSLWRRRRRDLCFMLVENVKIAMLWNVLQFVVFVVGCN